MTKVFASRLVPFGRRIQLLGIDFVVAVRDAVARIGNAPRTWTLAPNLPEPLGVRRLLLRRFPYAIVYVELDDEIRVLAIAHTSREPGFWRERLK